jgi:Flp pilus assembly protein TadB
MTTVQEPFIAIAAIATAIAIVVTLILVIVIQQIQLRRYEKFRRELTDVLGNFVDNFVDINARLTAAGYPPGRVQPSTYPAWVAQVERR